MMNIVLLSGSFHNKSISKAILKIIADQLSDHHCSIPALNELPFYSEDIEGANRPEVVLNFLKSISIADGIVFCSPEYNHSIPAVLKNAIDWASRPAFNSPLKDKPVTIITQADSDVGGARAQAHLKLVLDSTLSRLHVCHEMMISGVNKKFNNEQLLIDGKTLERIHHHVQRFIQFIQ